MILEIMLVSVSTIIMSNLVRGLIFSPPEKNSPEEKPYVTKTNGNGQKPYAQPLTYTPTTTNQLNPQQIPSQLEQKVDGDRATPL